MLGQVFGLGVTPYTCVDGKTGRYCKGTTSGWTIIAKNLQLAINAALRALGAADQIKVDGYIGSITLNAYMEIQAARGRQSATYTNPDALAANAAQVTQELKMFATAAGQHVSTTSDTSQPAPPAQADTPLGPGGDGGIPSWVYWTVGGIAVATVGYFLLRPKKRNGKR